ncbi:MAG: NAD(P)-dependent oxidoreductase [Devosia sp.]|uniref:NAD-dependent epimerase/dehydratase family protein n=1 Tax=Devosia sp. TaxID=1871048 RepID=UPI0026274BC3|nr:NAD(P)-dependent oxidoreductase [Devosia sp.]MDB5531316.1 NAD(P)-dependent oxidoreductase [Devosia sp.]
MKILVTGGAGLVGMTLRQTLQRAGHQVTAIDVTDFGRGDTSLTIMGLDDAGPLDALVTQNGIEAIIHCGGISGPMLAAGKPMLLVDVNITATARLLDIARRHGMKRFVFCSSVSAYGDVGPGTITETTPLHPTSVYGASKVAGEALVDGFATEYGLDGISLRIARVYGPYRRANCYLGDIIRNTEKGLPTEIPCEDDFKYHYIHVDDVADALLTVLEAKSLPSRAYNVSNLEMTMPQIAEIARRTIAGARVNLVAGADDVPDVQSAFDITKIDRELGWRPRLDLAAGLLAYRDAIRSGNAA